MGMPDTNINILVVDDMAAMRKILKTLLAQLGYKNVDEAEDGKQALEILKKNPNKYGLVITDWNMPNMTGIELVQEIRKDPELKHLPILMVTAEAKKENVLMAIKAGVNNYIVKPFTAETLKEKIEKIFSSLKK
ncbi:two-component system, chemotaxis family, response regulator CheY [Desulfurobacterium pacificum]|jgi:two-component system chemotaxis response regulator CheY|uniref:Two-component system, chemotaxis family, response regulator CheY n=1 Tax=Desulfurobacterium pacificum TaxID=240166 RepID=A0ABY1NPN2_9BACT|nr:chemotaxis response regulator CheY [Desulfurobacterium pacificum]SMP15001.1 two-component system, chemotaxis family, response regulator CheY [Desulfurobacterium pacificum]